MSMLGLIATVAIIVSLLMLWMDYSEFSREHDIRKKRLEAEEAWRRRYMPPPLP